MESNKIATISQDADSAYSVIEFNEDFLKENDWQVGDEIEVECEPGRLILKNISKDEREKGKIFLVKTELKFEVVYAVQGVDKETAIKMVAEGKFEEMYSEVTTEDVVKIESVSEQEYIHFFDEKLEYLKNVGEKRKMEFINTEVCSDLVNEADKTIL